MAKRLYVGNLTFAVTSADLRTIFAPHGSVESAQVQVDRETGRSRGFGFVLMTDDAEAENAVNAIDGTEHLGRRLNVNEAQPPTPASPPRPGPRSGPGPGPRPGRRS